ncbi:unnamed protein product [Acanthoscelides obtectus]|uniref:Uncharacterized protein n=1 Tax=Acanthoscelides obtectus TaxID=200917 RepID=A0A9P0MES4_ACAOB|nr:unnamed protein product [Acanthoscelides obtectus]CAK1639542.1 hypothetical protein AOBTE_LOCUS11234 [Acanthoscelides obtectus]
MSVYIPFPVNNALIDT